MMTDFGNNPREDNTPSLFETEASEQQVESVEYTVEELLISCVQARPAHWDSRLPLKDRSKTIRDQLWIEIYNEFGENPEFSIEFLQKKWRNLRDTYVRLKGEYTASGSAAKKKKKWEYFYLLSFLSDTINYKPTVSNIQLSSPSTSCSPTLLSPSYSDTEARSEVTSRNHPLEVEAEVQSEHLSKKQLPKVETAIIEALNKINNPVQDVSLASFNPICLGISQMLEHMPQKQRTEIEIRILQVAYEGCKDFLK